MTSASAPDLAATYLTGKAPIPIPTTPDTPNHGVAMRFVVNTSLGMKAGKIAGQVAHAAFELGEKWAQSSFDRDTLWKEWAQNGKAKIVLKGTPEIIQALVDRHPPSNRVVVYDLGRTQIPSGSLTVVGFIPMRGGQDAILDGLKLV